MSAASESRKRTCDFVVMLTSHLFASHNRGWLPERGIQEITALLVEILGQRSTAKVILPMAETRYVSF